MHLLRRVAVGFALLLSHFLLVAPTQGEVFRFRGTGTLGGTAPPFGMLGEVVNLTFDVDSELLSYDPSEAPAVRNFAPASPIALSMIGATSGAFPDIDSVTLLRAVDGAPGSADDYLEIRSGTESAFDTLFRLRCPGGDCFDDTTAPTTSADLLSMLGAAVRNPNQWLVEPAQIHSDAAQSTYTVDQMDWSVRSISHARGVAATFDVQYVPEEVPSITEGGTSLLAGGTSGLFPPSSTAILEFVIDAIPEGAILTSATLKLDVLFQAGSPTLTVVTYPGDGIASEEDGAAEGEESAIGPVNIVTASSLELDAEYIQSLRGTASHVGIRLSSETDHKYISFSSLENHNGAPVPTLLLEYLFEAPIGDFNVDGKVDAADYVLWRNTLGSTTDLAADADGNGEVGTEDYLIWKEAYGAAASGALVNGATSIPEPSTLVLMLSVLAFATRFPRRSRPIPT